MSSAGPTSSAHSITPRSPAGTISPGGIFTGLIEAFTPAARTAVPGRSVKVIDTVGAGDTFQAALIAGLAERGVWTRKDLDDLAPSQIAEVVGFAVSAASITCTRRGADLPRRAELATS